MTIRGEITCCRGCNNRTVEPNCHTTCEAYARQKIERAAYMEKVNEGRHEYALGEMITTTTARRIQTRRRANKV